VHVLPEDGERTSLRNATDITPTASNGQAWKWLVQEILLLFQLMHIYTLENTNSH